MRLEPIQIAEPAPRPTVNKRTAGRKPNHSTLRPQDRVRLCDGIHCHIDGLPCPKAGRCAEKPYMACLNCVASLSFRDSLNVCKACNRRRKCPGFKCFRFFGERKGGKSLHI